MVQWFCKLRIRNPCGSDIFNSIKGKSHFHKCVLFPREKRYIQYFFHSIHVLFKVGYEVGQGSPLSMTIQFLSYKGDGCFERWHFALYPST